MRQLSYSTKAVTDKLFEKKYTALGRIVNHWPEIIGQDMADKAQPVKLRYQKYKNADKPRVGLDIAASAADATILKMQIGLILERIQQVFGESWIDSIRFVTTPVNSNTLKSAKISKKKTRPLNQETAKKLDQNLSTISDPDVKERLLNLGIAIHQESL